MANLTTVARPYAKAMFAHAVDVRQLKFWSTALKILAYVAAEDAVVKFISNPATQITQQIEFLGDVFGSIAAALNFSVHTANTKILNNFIAILVHNKRVLLLPEISLIYETISANREQILQVNVIAFKELTAIQIKILIHKLKTRLQQDVTLNFTLDASLLGGIIIQANDLIIDSSVRGRLKKLQDSLFRPRS